MLVRQYMYAFTFKRRKTFDMISLSLAIKEAYERKCIFYFQSHASLREYVNAMDATKGTLKH